MSDLVHVKGLAQLEKFFDLFPEKFKNNILRGAMKAGMNVVKPVAASNIHSVSGKLAAGLKVGTRLKGDKVVASLKTKGEHGHVALWVEKGTKYHLINAINGSLKFGGAFRSVVEHPGSAPHPFMRPALDATAQAAVIAVGEYIKKRLTKQGLDTSYIAVEGDE